MLCEVRFIAIVKQLRFAGGPELCMHEGTPQSSRILIVLHWEIPERGVFIFE